MRAHNFQSSLTLLPNLNPSFAHNITRYTDFELNTCPLKRKKILKNLQSVYDYCSTHLPAPAFHLSPKELVEWGQSGLLNANILALLAHLFYCFETKGMIKPVLQKNSSFITQPLHSTPSNFSALRPPAHDQNRSCLHSSSDIATHKPLLDPEVLRRVPPVLRYNLQSRSADTLLASLNQKPAEVSSHVLDPQLNTSNASSSSNRVFQAPLRTSLNTSQSKALAAFDRGEYPLTKGSHSRSSPLIYVTAAPAPHPPNMTNLSSHSEVISISTKNLNLQNQMRASRSRVIRRSVTRQDNNPLRISHGRTGDKVAAQPPCSTDGVDDDDDGASSISLKLAVSDGKFAGDRQGPSSNEGLGGLAESQNMENLSSVRGSFTLNKQHTYASASAAGLPIISDREKLLVPRLVGEGISKSEPLVAKTTSAGSNLENPERSSEAIMLTNLLQLHRGGSTYTIASQKQSIPPNVKELRLNLLSFITSLQSDSTHMDREAKMQRLRLYPSLNKAKRDSKVASEDPLKSNSDIIMQTPNPTSASEPTVSDLIPTEDTRVDSKAFASVPTFDKQLTFLQSATVSSLEQFEHDELRIQLQTSPERDENNPSKPQTLPTEQQTQSMVAISTESGLASYQPLQKLPISPITSSGQVFIEQTPPLHSQSGVQVHPRAMEAIETMTQPNPWDNQLDQNQDARVSCPND